uniref:Metalloendoproteinase 1 n=1 Tax=Anthurium amnicola TaxID=1678845 RepID=A0A1D1Y833_9ARAE
MSSSSGLLSWVLSTLLAGAAAFVLLFSVAATGHPFFHGNDSVPFNPWEPFHNLSGCHLGDDRPGLATVKAYLNRFGYYPTDEPSNFSDAFDGDFEAAIRAYQHNFHLNATGALDAPTVDLMVQPRCGVADVLNGSNATTTHGRGLYSYFSGNPTWPPYKRHLTYAFTSTSSVSLDISTIRAVFARAFSRWSEATTLTFSEATDGAADMTIGFYSGDHGDGESFDGVLGTLAHAFSPPDGRFHLDAAEDWVEGSVAAMSGTAVDLESVAVHEIGHLLGLGHSTVQEAIMYPTIRAGTRKVELASDDVEGIQSLYGSNPSYAGAASSPSPSTTNTNTNTMREREANGAGGAPLQGRRWARAIGGVLVAVGAPLLVW